MSLAGSTSWLGDGSAYRLVTEQRPNGGVAGWPVRSPGDRGEELAR